MPTPATDIDLATAAELGQQLRAMYTDVVNEGVPNQFAELIQRLDKRDEK